MRYGFTRRYAHLSVSAGMGILIAAPILGVSAGLRSGPTPHLVGPYEPTWMSAIAQSGIGVVVLAGLVGLIAGVIGAVPLIVSGELILVFLEQRALLRRLVRNRRARNGGKSTDRVGKIARRLLDTR